MNIASGWFSLCLVAIGVTLAGCCTPGSVSSSAGFDFALIGDVPYREVDATNSYPNMIEEINRAKLAFVVHDGDIKEGASPCDDAALERCYKQCETFRHPFVLLFGDNEWTDCDRSGFDPVNRLEKLRELFTRGDRTMGQRTFPIERQSRDPQFGKFRENVRWDMGNVLLVGFNLTGSNNNFGKPEFAERNRANLAWLKSSFEMARRDQRLGILLMMQANPRFELAATNTARAGFNDFLQALEMETIAFGRPVVLAHGDSHYFRLDKPMISSHSKRRVENFTRVETFGYPDIHWVRGTVNPGDPNLFSFRQQIVRKNLVDHRN